MSIRTLFVGIDRYASPLINELSCSARDAQALYGLFVDTFGPEGSVLLTNEQCTRAALLSALHELHSAGAEDLVFVHFSGHGSSTHHLISHDTDPVDLDHTSIRLEDLVEAFAKIPARNVILSLDCCFSGGAGARVFTSPVALRATDSAEALLQRIGGNGRVILTASAAHQEAIEDRHKGHGLYSYFLLQALCGAPEIIESGKIPFLRLAQFVIESVEAAAAQFKHTQQPTLRGAIDGDVRLPSMVKGAVFLKYFPEQPIAPVTDDLRSLAIYEFPEHVCAALGAGIPALNELQQDAINQFKLFAGENLVVSAPTSSGKTMIGELAALKAHLRGERSYMLLPLRALVNDKHQELIRKYSPLGLRIIRSTGEIADDNDALLRGKFDIALLTYERFTALAVVAPHILRNVGLVVIDEVQMIADQGRGSNLEFLLTYLRSQRVRGVEPQLVALSAVIGDTNGFERWLGARLLTSSIRPVPLEEGVLSLRGAFHFIDTEGKEQSVQNFVSPEYRKGSSQDVIIPLVRQLVTAGEKVIVFRETKPIVRSTAAYLSASVGLPPATNVIQALPAGDPSAASATLRSCLNGGVAFHSADLDREEREAIETSFRDPNGEIKVLVATTTLAMGVNTPAWSVIIEGLEHPGGEPYSVAEYKNMVGRAGRLGWTLKGKAFLVAPDVSDEYRLWQRYVKGSPEALFSRFAEQDLLTAVCRVLGTATALGAAGLTIEEIVSFLQSTFAAFQANRTWSQPDIAGAVGRLSNAQLAESIEGRYRLTPLGNVAGQLGVEVESVVRVAAAFRGVGASQIKAETLLAATQLTVELDAVYLPIHKKSNQERARWQSVLSDQGLPRSIVNAIHRVPDPDVTARCKRFAAVLMWTQGVELDKLEASLLRHLPSENAAGSIRAVADRTRDLIGVVGRIAQILNPNEEAEITRLDNLLDRLSAQLELGITSDMFWLARSLGRSLSRGEYLALRREGLADPLAFDESQRARLEKVLVQEVKRNQVFHAIEKLKAKARGADLPMPASPQQE